MIHLCHGMMMWHEVWLQFIWLYITHIVHAWGMYILIEFLEASFEISMRPSSPSCASCSHWNRLSKCFSKSFDWACIFLCVVGKHTLILFLELFLPYKFSHFLFLTYSNYLLTFYMVLIIKPCFSSMQCLYYKLIILPLYNWTIR